MRGKAECLTCCRFAHGITPAYAGKRAPHPAGGLERQDHPRVCGEKCRAFLHLTVVVGSPPRMRGKGIQPCNQWVRVGITPAYAGKRAAPSGSSMASWDHPRVCGEKPWRSPAAPGTQGSPPRMRGKAASTASTSLKTGITPAYAGKSLGAARVAGTGQDHPRVCGEKKLPIYPVAARLWITPAYAGKSGSE